MGHHSALLESIWSRPNRLQKIAGTPMNEFSGEIYGCHAGCQRRLGHKDISEGVPYVDDDAILPDVKT